MTTPTTLAPAPYQAAPDTWVIPELFDGPPGAYVPVNSVVITGREPVIVDTGTALNRDRWFDAVGSVVDLVDVRWIYLSHDDHDHVGNLAAVLDAAPLATLVTTWFQGERLAGDLRLPVERSRWLNNGETFDVGDRLLHAVRPPIFDSPTTRGLFDSRTGFYWAGDAFASFVPGPVTDVGEIPHDMWRESFVDLNRMISPWHAIVDPVKFDRVVDDIASLGITSMTGAHGTVMRDGAVADALELIRTIAGMEEVTLPSQPDLDAMLASVGALPAET
jgi:flavorubredoxin